jgi:hypothetical protein
MADVTLVQGDTRPSLEATLKVTRTQAALDLSTAAAVKFQMRQVNNRRYTVDSPAVVISAEDGSVRYDWQTGDLAVAGDYVGQFEITWNDGTIQTTRPANTITVERQ